MLALSGKNADRLQLLERHKQAYYKQQWRYKTQ
jgi:hypothetical protein